jgi:FtsP/CotA-like multicopper oxidase with cupredoxin domain
VGRRFDIEVINTSGAQEVQLQVELPSRDGGFTEYPMYTGTLQGEGAPPAFLEWTAPALPPMKPTTQEVVLEFNGEGGGTGIRWTINGKTYDEADEIVVKQNTPTKLLIKEKSGAEHPFHLHGQFFRLVDRGNRAGMPMVPGQMDTVLVDGDEMVQLYTEFENPGRWMAHCHILEHAESGMMVEIVVEE